MPWSRSFDDPIPLPKGRQLVTLQDAADFIMNPFEEADGVQPATADDDFASA
jgi:hypothetical protein